MSAKKEVALANLQLLGLPLRHSGMAQAGTRKPVDFSATDRPTGSDALTSAMPWRSRWPLLPLLLLALHLDFVHFAWQRGWRGWHTARPARPQARDPNPNQTAKVWSKLEMLEAAPRLADARVASDKLFRNLSNGNETLPCTQALEFTQTLWQGVLPLLSERNADLLNDAAALLIVLDSDKDGRITLDEFIEYAATLVQLKEPQVPPLSRWWGNISDPEWSWMWNETLCVSRRMLGHVLREYWDSIDMLSEDIRYSLRLLRRVSQGEVLDSMERSLLRRAASDAVTLVPATMICAQDLPVLQVGLFMLIKSAAPKLLPSSFSPSRLQLLRAWRQVRQHPDFKDWTLYGGSSEELDAAVLAIFKNPKPASIRKLFEELDQAGAGSIKQSAVLSIVQSIWSGQLNLPKQSMEDFRMDASALMVVVDRRSGSLTLGEFTEYIQTLVEVANAYNQRDQRDPVEVVRAIPGDVSDSMFTLLRDLRYAVHVVKKRLKGKLSKMERAMFRRTTKDVASSLPYFAVVLSHFSPVLKILACILLCKSATHPSAFTKPRRRFARAWAAIAVRQRARAVEGWKCQASGERMEEIILGQDRNQREQLMSRLFQELDDGSGTLTYGQVFAVAQPILKLSRNDGILDALGLIIQIASDTDGAVTQTEFVDFLETLLVDVGKVKIVKDEAIKTEATSWFGSKFQLVKRVAQKEVRELVDSVSMIGQDIAYSAGLVRSPAHFAEIERSWLRRTLKDIVLFLPVGAIIVAPLTPVGTAIVIAIFKRAVPALVPSSFRRHRLELMHLGKTPVEHIPCRASLRSKDGSPKNGIVSQLTRVLVGLYEEPERPANAIDYIKKYLGAPTGVDVEELRADNDELRRQNAELEAKVASLTQQLKELQTEQEEQVRPGRVLDLVRQFEVSEKELVASKFEAEMARLRQAALVSHWRSPFELGSRTAQSRKVPRPEDREARGASRDVDTLSTCSTEDEAQAYGEAFALRLKEFARQGEPEDAALAEFASPGLPAAFEERVCTRAYFLYLDGCKDDRRNYFQALRTELQLISQHPNPALESSHVQ
ncbi:unnamed protein product [Effrenium voratum]|uniref:EF-hand domain-containing protein n=1 Tax=Effrenium voratum TaxID=2562239 RepID=A0AA36NH47_9DINO|nr:unnamed protein product [Effrenium voratum]